MARNYDQVLSWIAKVVDVDSLFGDYFGEDAIRSGKSSQTRFEEFRSEVWSKVNNKFDSDGAPSHKRQGIPKIVRELLVPYSTDLGGGSRQDMSEHWSAKGFKDAREATKWGEGFEEYRRAAHLPRKKPPKLPKELDRPEFIEGLNVLMAETIQDLPTVIREPVRLKIPPEYRPTTVEAGTVEGDEYTTKRGAVFEITPDIDAALKRHVGSNEDWTTWEFTAKQLKAFGAKKKR